MCPPPPTALAALTLLAWSSIACIDHKPMPLADQPIRSARLEDIDLLRMGMLFGFSWGGARLQLIDADGGAHEYALTIRETTRGALMSLGAEKGELDIDLSAVPAPVTGEALAPPFKGTRGGFALFGGAAGFSLTNAHGAKIGLDWLLAPAIEMEIGKSTFDFEVDGAW